MGTTSSRYPIGPALPRFRSPSRRCSCSTERIPPGSRANHWFDTTRSAAAITTLAGALPGRPEEGRLGASHGRVDGSGPGLGFAGARQPEPLARPAALMLTSLILLLWPENPSLAVLRAGVTAAMFLCCRPIDLAFAVVTALGHDPSSGLIWFLPPAAAIGAALIGYNRLYLGAAADTIDLRRRRSGRRGT